MNECEKINYREKNLNNQDVLDDEFTVRRVRIVLDCRFPSRYRNLGLTDLTAMSSRP
jgi:hypothetical protein